MTRPLQPMTVKELAELYAAVYAAGVLAGQLSRLQTVFTRGVNDGMAQALTIDTTGAKP